MSRYRRFVEELSRSIEAAGTRTQKIVRFVINWVLPALGIGGVAGLFVWLRPATPVQVSELYAALIPFIVFLSTRIGAAWQRSAGAEISMSDLKCRKDHNDCAIYFVTVTNEGSKPVKPRVSVLSATDLDGNRTDLFDSSFESAWGLRVTIFPDRCPPCRPDLAVRGMHADATPLGIRLIREDGMLHQVTTYPLASQTGALMIMCRLDERKPIVVTLQADCGELGNPAQPIDGNVCTKTFLLSPVDGSQDYLITPFRPVKSPR
jgi:hypothetical protein